MKAWRDIVGMLLIASGVAGVFFGIRTATGPGGNDASAVSSACIGAGTAANFVAFRVMRQKSSSTSSTTTTSSTTSLTPATRSTRSKDDSQEATTADEA